MKTIEQMIEEAADKPTTEEARSALARLAEGIHREAPVGEASTWYERIMDARDAIEADS